MTKQIEELERLNELRQQGALSEGEYAEAKAKILAATTQAKGSGGLSPWVGRGAGAVGLAIAIFVIKPLIRPHHADGPPPNAASTSGDGWEVTEKRNPMTDATVRTATRVFEGEQANITLAVSCDSTGAVRYEATSFDKDGKPAEMLQKPYYAGFYVPYDLRVDGNPPVGDSNINPRYSNQISVEPIFSDSNVQGSAADFEARDPARASKLTFGFHLAHGDETIIVGQAGSPAAAVLAPCVAVRHVRLLAAAEKERLFQQRRNADAASSAAQAATERNAQQQAAEAQRDQDQRAEKQRALNDQLAEEHRQRSNQVANCEQIRRSGTTDPAYLRMEGCM